MAGFWEGTEEVHLGPRVKNVKLSMGYMWDADGDDYQSEGYIGLLFLGAEHPASDRARPLGLRNFRFFSGKGSFEQGGDPNNDAERYQVLNGTAPFSLPVADPRTGLRPRQISFAPNDYRMVVSAGPFGRGSPPRHRRVQAAPVLRHLF